MAEKSHTWIWERIKANRQKLTTIVSVLFSLIVIIYVLLQTDWRLVQATFATLNWGWLLIAFVIFILNYVLRTIRFRRLIYSKRVPFLPLLSVTNLYGMYNYLLPAKSGEVTYPLLLKRRLAIPLTESVISLLVARFFDFVTIALFLPAVLIAFWKQMPDWLLVASLIFSIGMYLITGASRWFLRRMQSRDPSSTKDAIPSSRWRQVFHNLLASLWQIDKQGDYWQFLLVTISIWFCVYANFFFILLSLGYQVNFFQMVIVSIIMVPMTLLPVQGVANLGTHEIGWVVAFQIFGYSEQFALNVAVSSHMLLLLFVFILGAIGFLMSILTDRMALQGNVGND